MHLPAVPSLACKLSLKGVYIDGVKNGGYQYNPTLGTLRVTNLNKDINTAAGTTVRNRAHNVTMAG